MNFLTSEVRYRAGHCATKSLCLVVCAAAIVSACSEPPLPRTFTAFMEDRIAREGTLVRCNSDPDAAATDIECANARRAAAAIALRQEREQREALERESEFKLAALRDRLDERQRQADAEAAREEQAYEELWREEGAARPSQPDDGLEELVVPSRFGWRPAAD